MTGRGNNRIEQTEAKVQAVPGSGASVDASALLMDREANGIIKSMRSQGAANHADSLTIVDGSAGGNDRAVAGAGKPGPQSDHYLDVPSIGARSAAGDAAGGGRTPNSSNAESGVGGGTRRSLDGRVGNATADEVEGGGGGRVGDGRAALGERGEAGTEAKGTQSAEGLKGSEKLKEFYDKVEKQLGTMNLDDKTKAITDDLLQALRAGDKQALIDVVKRQSSNPDQFRTGANALGYAFFKNGQSVRLDVTENGSLQIARWTISPDGKITQE